MRASISPRVPRNVSFIGEARHDSFNPARDSCGIAGCACLCEIICKNNVARCKRQIFASKLRGLAAGVIHIRTGQDVHRHTGEPSPLRDPSAALPQPKFSPRMTRMDANRKNPCSISRSSPRDESVRRRTLGVRHSLPACVRVFVSLWIVRRSLLAWLKLRVL